MTPDRSDERDVERGRLAQEVLDNPIYTEAYEAIEQEVIKQWRAARNQQDREQLHQLLLMNERVRVAMEAVMRSGEIAQAELRRKASKLERLTGGILHRS